MEKRMENKKLSLKPYRRAAVPLLAIQTADPAEIVRLAVREAANGTQSPVLTWDCVHGIRAANVEAQPLAATMNQNQEPAIATGNPVEALRAVELATGDESMDKAILVFVGLAEILTDPQSGMVTRQALWNLRDVLTPRGALLVLTAPLGWRNPLPDDIAVAVSPLPDREQHKASASRICKDAGLAEPDSEIMDRVSDALLGLSDFSAQQALALSLTKQGIDMESVRARKRQQISETPGLSVYDGKERFADLGGLSEVKEYFKSILNGRRKPGAIIYVDEVDKAMAGSTGDTSGVTQAVLGYWLTYMQDQNASGSIFIGPGGSGKSAFAKAVGNEGDIPTVQFDLSGIKGSLVGESEGKMRTALAVVTAISGNRPLFLATCNSIATLPPELRRRFTLGTWFFDLPSSTEQRPIWDIYLRKYEMEKQPLPACDGWTGAEIKACCDLADRTGLPLTECAARIVPISVAAKELIDRLRNQSAGRYLSASYPGLYQIPQVRTVPIRKISV